MLQTFCLPPKLRKEKKVRREIRAKILRGESFPELDQVIRSLAAKAYNVALLMEKEGDREAQLMWMKLVARLVSLSLEPKKLAELEEIKKALAEIKRHHYVSCLSLHLQVRSIDRVVRELVLIKLRSARGESFSRRFSHTRWRLLLS